MIMKLNLFILFIKFLFVLPILIIPSFNMQIEINTAQGITIIVILIIVFILIYIWKKSARITTIQDLPRRCSGIKLSGIVTYISDGDGFHFFHTPFFRSAQYKSSDPKLKIRLGCIDAPEIRYFNVAAQPLSKESKDYLSTLILHKKVKLEILGVDRYDRILAIVYLKRLCFNTNVNIEMLKSGLACVYSGKDEIFGNYKDLFIEVENTAKKNKKGIWGLNNMILPMDYKKMRRKETEI